jgi:hypothetical protein
MPALPKRYELQWGKTATCRERLLAYTPRASII